MGHRIAVQEQCTTEKEVAHQIKTEFDQTYEPTWHCVVGRHFGSYVTHEKSQLSPCVALAAREQNSDHEYMGKHRRRCQKWGLTDM